MMVRHCRVCDTEFQPHVVRCSDCGGPLEDVWPDLEEAPSRPENDAIEETSPPGDYVVVARDLAPGTAEHIGRDLGAADIAFRLAIVRHHGLELSVRSADAAAATVILEKAQAIPAQPDPDQPAVGEVGGPCPACGAAVTAGATECPECGLGVASPPATCALCGSELPSPWEPCRACAQRREG
jgi:hypothetical protein